MAFLPLLFGLIAAHVSAAAISLEAFLSEVDLLEYRDQFVAQGFGDRPEALALLSSRDGGNDLLKEMGLAGAERLVVLAHARELRESKGTAKAVSTTAASPVHRRAQQQAPDAVSTAGFWLKSENGKIVIGPNADVSVFRAGANVLATGGGLKLGTVDTCAASGDAGTLRWSPGDAALQVCAGEAGWATAGGGVLDAADGDACDADAGGSLRWDAAAGALAVCDGAAAAWADVVLAHPTDGGGGATIASLLLSVHNATAPPAPAGLARLYVRPGADAFAAGGALADGLLAYYAFDEPDGTAAADATGAHAGTVHGGAAVVAGKVGAHARAFDGADDYVDCGSYGLSGSDPVTVAAWIKPDAGNPTFAGIVHLGGVGLQFHMNTAYSDRDLAFHDPGLTNVHTTTMEVPDDGGWHHVAVAFNGAPLTYQRAAIYLDGEAQAIEGNEAHTYVPPQGTMV